MALRFLAILSQNESVAQKLAHQVEQASDLAKTYNASSMVVFADAPKDCLCLPGSVGAILGNLFTREAAPSKIGAFSDTECVALRRTSGDYLIRRAWGGYVSIIQDENARAYHVLRDPSGALPCYHIVTDGATIVVSDIETFYQAGFQKPDIDWPYLTRHFMAYDLRSSKSALEGFDELHPGFKLTVGEHGQSVAQIWSPWDFIKPERSSDAEIDAELGDVVSACVEAQALCHEHILLGLSGGLDSSVIAAILARSAVKFTGFTMTTNEGGGDERRYARELAHLLKAPLIEAQYDLDQVDVTQPTSAHLPRPIGRAYAQSGYRAQLDIAKGQGIEAFFSGIGGDNVFCYLQSATPLIDRLKANGSIPGLWATANDICKMTNCSLWDVFHMAVKRARRDDPAYIWTLDKSFLANLPARTVDLEFSHPWLDAPNDALPGKAVHIANILRVHGTLDAGIPRTQATQINPLLSQPIIEFCLRIRTWRWCAGGENRAPVRRAFSPLLPPLIRHRRTKGGPDSFHYEVNRRHRPLLQSHLLNGLLAEHGVIDTLSLASVFQSPQPFTPTQNARISALAEAEAWARFWDARPRRAMASQTRA